MRLIRTLILSLCIGVSAAHADPIVDAIIAYNEAKESGNRAARISTALELGNAALSIPDDPNAPIMAYEAGQTLCMLNQCLGAQPFAVWVATQDAALAGRQPADLALLSALATWKTDPDRTNRTSLDEVLGTLQDEESTLLSVLAFKARFEDDLSKGRWRDLRQSAGAAAAHLRQDKSNAPALYFSARAAELSGRFNSNPDDKAYRDFALLEQEIDAFRFGVPTKADSQLETVYWMISAWGLATEAYAVSVDPNPKRRQRLIDEERAELNAAATDTVDCRLCWESENVAAMEGETVLPFCDGELVMEPELVYPRNAAWRGLFGSVLLRLEIEDAAVVNPEVLAAVPFNAFQETVLDTVGKWRWDVSDGTPGVTCGLDRKNIVLPFTFVIR